MKYLVRCRLDAGMLKLIPPSCTFVHCGNNNLKCMRIKHYRSHHRRMVGGRRAAFAGGGGWPAAAAILCLLKRSGFADFQATADAWNGRKPCPRRRPREEESRGRAAACAPRRRADGPGPARRPVAPCAPQVAACRAGAAPSCFFYRWGAAGSKW